MTSSRTGWFTLYRLAVSSVLVLVGACCSSAFAQRGIQEFTASGAFQVPLGVSTLRVEAYGAGGGGGGGTSSVSGGGGGGGAYNAGVISVSPGAVLTIVVGKGGAGGSGGNPGGAGSPGGASKILNSSKVVLFSASGGTGGGGASGTTNGTAGTGGAPGTFGTIRHAGQNALQNSGAYGYIPAGFTIFFNDPFGQAVRAGFGSGGSGGGFPSALGGNGISGYILITW